MSPAIVRVTTALVPSMVAAITVPSVPEAPVTVIAEPVAAATLPISISTSEELPTKVIDAVMLSQPEVAEPLSQLKSILLLLPVVLKVPVNCHHQYQMLLSYYYLLGQY